jgi:hypothetical protein
MPIKPYIQDIFLEIWQEAGYPPVNLITATEFKERTGFSLDNSCVGRSYAPENIFCIRQNQTIREIKDSIWHEMLHCIYPRMPEWWISCAAYKLSGNTSDFWGHEAMTKNKSPRNCLPSREILIELINDSSFEMNLGY